MQQGKKRRLPSRVVDIPVITGDAMPVDLAIATYVPGDVSL